MIVGLDSATPPTPAQARAAAAAGVQLWNGYIATRARVGLYHPWSQADFEAARLCGSTPIAFCSGWDDPVACMAAAAAWDVRLCLDVEGGIRPDGNWVQQWLAASGAGLYGNLPVHVGRHADFHVLAAYFGADPKATWSGPRPLGPCGWQWKGTHSEFGVGVDRGWYDDWFAGLHGAGGGNITGGFGAMTDAQISSLFDNIRQNQVADRNAILKAITDGNAAVVAAIKAIPAATGGGLTDADRQTLAGIAADAAATRMRVEKDLAA